MGAISNETKKFFITELRERNEAYQNSKRQAELDASKMLSAAINGSLNEIAGKYGSVPCSVNVDIEAYEVMGKRYPSYRLGNVVVEFE